MTAASAPARTGISLDKVEYWFTIFAFFVLIGAAEFVFTVNGLGAGAEADFEAGDSNPFKLLMTTGVYVVAIALAMRREERFFRIVFQNWLFFLIAMMPLLSLVWSVDMVTTFRRSVAVTLTGVFCFYVVATLSPEEMLRRLMVALFIAGVLSFAVSLLMPSVGVHAGSTTGFGAIGGSWKGVFGHKAQLGRTAAFGCLLPLFVRPAARWQMLMKYATAAMYVVLLYESQSRTNWICVLAGLSVVAMLIILRPSRLSGSLRAGTATIVIVTAIVLGIVLEPVILEIFNRDSSLSGRSALWEEVLDITSRRFPLTGSGYGAFFTSKGGNGELEVAFAHWARIPGHAHNGYINLWIETGVIGIASLAVLLIYSVIALVRRAHAERRLCWMAFGVVLAIFLVNNYSGSVAYRHSDISWVLLLCGALYLRVVAAPARQPMPTRRVGVTPLRDLVPLGAVSTSPTNATRSYFRPPR